MMCSTDRPADGPRPPARRRTGVWRTAAWGLGALGLAVGAVACGDDDDEADPQEAYCEAGAELRSSISALADLDLISEGTNGLQTRLDAIRDDLSDLRDAGEEAAADEIDALDTAVDDLGSAIEDVSGSLSQDNVAQVGAAIGDVTEAAQAVYTTLSDCPS